MTEKESAIMYLKAIVAMLNQNKNFPGDFEILDGYFAMGRLAYDNYKMEVLENE